MLSRAIFSAGRLIILSRFAILYGMALEDCTAEAARLDKQSKAAKVIAFIALIAAVISLAVLFSDGNNGELARPCKITLLISAPFALFFFAVGQVFSVRARLARIQAGVEKR
jgi:uncharacterized membrane protein